MESSPDSAQLWGTEGEGGDLPGEVGDGGGDGDDVVHHTAGGLQQRPEPLRGTPLGYWRVNALQTRWMKRWGDIRVWGPFE